MQALLLKKQKKRPAPEDARFILLHRRSVRFSRGQARCFRYSDEVTSGNAMRHCNERKLQCVYWSLKQHDTLLSSERHWFLLGVCRSEIVRRIKGRMSSYIRMCMEQLYTPHDARQGLFVTLASGDRALFFLRISIIVADAAALRGMYDFKGASGTLLCPLCRNVVDVKSTWIPTMKLRAFCLRPCWTRASLSRTLTTRSVTCFAF